MRDWQRYLNENQDRFRSELQAFVAIPSVSAQPAHADDVRRAGHWVLDRLTAAGMENARMMETGGHPVVYADWRHAPGRPTILIYGHFDVQPAEPLELWDTPPFEPVIRDGRLFGRGASDDKGGMLIPILALEAMLRAGSLGVNVKCLFEGQEEIGSPDLPGFMASHRDMFATDMIFSADGAQWSETEPALLMGTKGLVGFEITITATDEDKHSGVAGAVVANPLMAMAHVLAGMKDARTGRVLIDGFYDNVADLSAEERAQIARIPHDDAAFARRMGAVDVWGEDGFTTLERMGTRPSLDVNGMHGGYQGDGTKTVHPARAVAKLTCRLVPGQTPEDIFAKVQQHLARHTPAGVRLSVDRLPGSALPFGLPEGHNATRIARDVLAEVYGTEPLPIRVGGSIPILPVFLQELGVHTVGFAFALMDERQHAPNEFFRLSSFEKGQVAYCRLFEALAQKT